MRERCTTTHDMKRRERRSAYSITSAHSAVSALIVRGIAIALAAAVLAAQPPARTPDIHYVPTRQTIANAMLELARVTRDDVVYDLGSGDGRIVVIAAQRFGARGVGIEIDRRLVERSREIAREAGVADRVTFIEGDLFTTDIAPATVVTLYLSTTVNMRLEPKLKRELRPGTRIVSQQFRIGAWPPDVATRAENQPLFLWTVR